MKVSVGFRLYMPPPINISHLFNHFAMTKSIYGLFAAAIIAAPAWANNHPQPRSVSPTQRVAEQAMRHISGHRQWSRNASAQATRLAAPTKTDYDAITPATSQWGSLYVPSGETWMYTADLEYDANNSISGANITLYDANMAQYGSLSIALELGENETSINLVDVAPILTRKFFNYDDEYELMVFVHATTADYTGHCYTLAYSLKDGALITRFEGNFIGSIDTAIDQWSEKYTMAFMREIYDADFNYSVYFDIYTPVSWGDSEPVLQHTFEIDYSLFAGAENYALPILMNSHNREIYYALPHYEKPYFADGDFWEEPEINPDNKFIIDLYDSKFEIVKTTVIPMTQKEGALYSFPGIGIFTGNDDLTFGYYNDSEEPVYVVGFENYITTSDDFNIDLYLYDADGNMLDTIAMDVADYIRLYDIPGQDTQYCFLNAEGDPVFTMVDMPSCDVAAQIDLYLPDGNNITTSFDRTRSANSYKYVSTLPNADVDDAGNAIHVFAWFDAEGNFERYDKINLGDKVVMALPYISGEAFNPFLFNTDTHIEYMLLVKEQISQSSSASSQYLKIYSDNNDLVLNIGPDEDTGEIIISAFLYNVESSHPKLMVGYVDYNTGLYTLRSFDMPFNRFSAGDGSVENPYVISTPGDLMAMHFAPTANYVIGNDIDFEGLPISSNPGEFYGALDGQGHVLCNLNLVDGAIFDDLADNSLVKDITIANSTLSAANGDNAGFIAKYAMGLNEERHATISGVHIYDSTIQGSNATAGAILGTGVVYSVIEGCSAENVDINVDGNSEVGGIVGRLQTSAKVIASAYSGSVVGAVAGGIVGITITGGEAATDCHANAQIAGANIAGGIIGDAARGPVTRCYAQGSVQAGKYAGGIIGSLAVARKDSSTPVVSNNIVAMESIAVADAQGIAHRIVGLSSSETYEIDWNNVTSDMEPEDYPRVPCDPEKGLADNYAIGLDAINAEMEGIGNLEGAALDADLLTEQFLSDLGWQFGQSLAEPWEMQAEGPALYYEGDTPDVPDSAPGISDPQSEITISGNAVSSQGRSIVIYDAQGRPVAQGSHTVDISQLPKGIYIASDRRSTRKFMR